jgi:phosphoserine/homoserine phosphotransferase
LQRLAVVATLAAENWPAGHVVRWAGRCLRPNTPVNVEDTAVEIVCLDLEGVLIPEIWINFAERTGIDALRATTRDIPDYDVLMKQRLKILDEHGYGLPDIQAVIDDMGPLEGALDFVNWLREHFQVIILSDTFYEFAKPMMRQLGWPTLLCHKLEVNAEGKITDYKLRQKDPKRMSVKALHGLNYRVIAAGDSYNDTTMLAEADAGILFHAPDNVIAEFPQFPSVQTFDALREEIVKASNRDIPLS